MGSSPFNVSPAAVNLQALLNRDKSLEIDGGELFAFSFVAGWKRVTPEL